MVAQQIAEGGIRNEGGGGAQDAPWPMKMRYSSAKPAGPPHLANWDRELPPRRPPLP